MSFSSDTVSAIGIDNTLATNDGGTINDFNVGAQLAAAAAAQLSTDLPANKVAGAAAIMAGGVAFFTQTGALIVDLGNPKKTPAEKFGDVTSLIGDLAVAVGGAAQIIGTKPALALAKELDTFGEGLTVVGVQLSQDSNLAKYAAKSPAIAAVLNRVDGWVNTLGSLQASLATVFAQANTTLGNDWNAFRQVYSSDLASIQAAVRDYGSAPFTQDVTALSTNTNAVKADLNNLITGTGAPLQPLTETTTNDSDVVSDAGLQNQTSSFDAAGSTVVVSAPSAKSSDSVNYDDTGAITSSAVSVGDGDTFNAITNTVNETMTFAGSSGTAILADPTTFTGTVYKFQSGDIVDLAGVAVSSATLGANNLLTLSTGTTIQFDPTQNFTGYQFTTKPDGNGGTDITLIPTPPKSITVTVTGVLANAQDTTGVFGAANTSLNGDAFKVVLTIDPSLGVTGSALNTTKSESFLEGNGNGSVMSAVLTINGHSVSMNNYETNTAYVAERYSESSSLGQSGGVSYYFLDATTGAVNIGIHSLNDSAPWISSYNWEAPYSYTMTANDENEELNNNFSSFSIGQHASGDFIIGSITQSDSGVTPPVVHNVTTSGPVGGANGDEWHVTANAVSASVVPSNTSPIFIQGNNDSVNLGEPTASFTLTDAGQGTQFLLPFSTPNGVTISIADFKNDKSGVLTLVDQFASPAAAVAALQSDGHGGSLLTLSGGKMRLDFIGDTTLTTANFHTGTL